MDECRNTTWPQSARKTFPDLMCEFLCKSKQTDSKRSIYDRFGSTAYLITSSLCWPNLEPKGQSSFWFHSNTLHQQRVRCWGRNVTHEGRSRSPSESDSSTRPGRSPRTESHWREAAIQAGDKQGFLKPSTRRLWWSVSSGHFVVNDKVKICWGNFPSCPDP